MTKKEIIDKVYDDYLRDYENWGSGGTNMDSVEKACKSKFEKNGIEYSLYDIKRELENKSDYNIVNAYVKGYTDTKEDINYSDIESFIVQYKQGLDAGNIEYKDAEFERVAEVFKMYEGYGSKTDDKEAKDAIDSLKKDVNLYLSETSSDKESVQNAYKAINAYVYGDSSFDNLSEQVKGIDPADMKEAFSKLIKDNYYLQSRLSRVENPNEVSTPMRCIAPIKVVSKTEQSSEKYLQELPIKGFVLEAVPLSSFEHKVNEPYADRANKGLFTKPPIHWQMMPKEYFGLCFAFKARA